MSIDHICNPVRRPVIFASVLIIQHGASGATARSLVASKVYIPDTEPVKMKKIIRTAAGARI